LLVTVPLDWYGEVPHLIIAIRHERISVLCALQLLKYSVTGIVKVGELEFWLMQKFFSQ